MKSLPAAVLQEHISPTPIFSGLSGSCKKNLFRPGLQLKTAAMNDLNDNNDDGDNQEKMNKPAHGVGADKAEKPEEHVVSPVEL